MKAWLKNCVPLSVVILFWTPNRQTNPLKNVTADFAVTFLTGSTSGHFLKLSMVTYKNSKPPIAWGKGPKISSPRPRKAKRE